MAGISPKLPLMLDPTNGYALNQTYAEAVKQNFKMLLLTSPGERIMDPDFGVGLRNYLFEFNNLDAFSSVSSKVYEQTSLYLPFVEIADIELVTQDEDPRLAPNTMHLRITYVITPLEFADRLDISVPVT